MFRVIRHIRPNWECPYSEFREEVQLSGKKADLAKIDAKDLLFEELMEELKDEEYRREYGAATAKYDLADVLSEARRQKGLTQQEMASLAGVSQAYIAKLESGEANPTIGHIGRILAAIGLRLHWTLDSLIPPDIPPKYVVTRELSASTLQGPPKKTPVHSRPSRRREGCRSGQGLKLTHDRQQSQPHDGMWGFAVVERPLPR